jgi:hypothetical protein
VAISISGRKEFVVESATRKGRGFYMSLTFHGHFFKKGKP